jgi:hypothetical protein
VDTPFFSTTTVEDEDGYERWVGLNLPFFDGQFFETEPNLLRFDNSQLIATLIVSVELVNQLTNHTLALRDKKQEPRQGQIKCERKTKFQKILNRGVSHATTKVNFIIFIILSIIIIIAVVRVRMGMHRVSRLLLLLLLQMVRE